MSKGDKSAAASAEPPRELLHANRRRESSHIRGELLLPLGELLDFAPDGLGPFEERVEVLQLELLSLVNIGAVASTEHLTRTKSVTGCLYSKSSATILILVTARLLQTLVRD